MASVGESGLAIVYLLDGHGQIRLSRDGEGYSQGIEAVIRDLLSLARIGWQERPADNADLFRIGTPEIGSLHPTPQDPTQSPLQGEATYSFAQPSGPKLTSSNWMEVGCAGGSARLALYSRRDWRALLGGKAVFDRRFVPTSPRASSVDKGWQTGGRTRHANAPYSDRWR